MYTRNIRASEHFVNIDKMTDRGILRNYFKMTIGKKIIDHKIIMKGIGSIAQINCTIETGTTPENTKETIHKVETGHGSVMVQIVPTVKTDRSYSRDRYRDDSYDKTSRSKEKDYLYDEDDIFHSKV